MPSVLLYTLIPAAGAILGAITATRVKLTPAIASAIQHFTAGVVFAAAAGEVLPDILRQGAVWPTVVGGASGTAAMLLISLLETWAKGPLAMAAAVSVDVFIDGLVLGIAFAAGQKMGLVLTVALTMELVFLGLTIADELGDHVASTTRTIGIVVGLVLFLPIGALLSRPVGSLSPPVVAGFFAFGLIALLYLVTEELLVKAHEVPDRPWVTAMFFTGFLTLLALEELIA